MSQEGSIDQGSVNQSSTTDNRGASYQNVGAVHNAPVNYNTIQQVDATKHRIDPQEPSLFEPYAKLILGWLGDDKTRLIGAVLLFLGIGTGVSPFYIDATPANLTMPLFLVGSGVGVVGASFLGALQFKQDSTCPQCKTEYALQEVDGATAREITSSDGPKKEISRPYVCSNCDYGFSKTYTVDVEPSE